MTTADASYLAADTPLAFAHRGGALYGPNEGIENSLVAFEHAVGLGYRYLETDARVSAEGTVFAFHDHTLDRTTDRRGVLAQLPDREIHRARIGGREPIPLLQDLLEAFPEARVNIDVKEDASVVPTLEAIERAGAADRVCVASFSHRRLRQVRRLAPHLTTSASPQEVARVVLRPRPRPRVREGGPGAACVQVPVRRGRVTIVSPRFVASAHALGLQVHVWTIDDEQEMHRLLDLGVDGLISDRIDVLRDVLTARGQWTGGETR